MPAVATAIASDLTAIQPAPAASLKAHARSFVSPLGPWIQALGSSKQKYPNTPVAVTEPVADYLLQAAGADIKTPFEFQADIMNGTDPSAQDAALARSLFP